MLLLLATVRFAGLNWGVIGVWTVHGLRGIPQWR